MTDRELLEQFNLLRGDFDLYSKVNLRLKNKSGTLVPFVHNRMQRYLYSLYKQDVDARRPIRWYVIKPRQEGSSKFFLALYYWLTTMNSNKNAILVCHDQPSSFNMLSTMQGYYMRSQKILRPNIRKMNRREIHFASTLEDFEKTGDVGLDSYIQATTADDPMLARSYTFQFAHLSEFAMWPELGIDIGDRMNALSHSVPDEPGTAIIIETTAMGENKAYDFWNDADNGYRKIFISRVCNEEYRITLPFENYEFELGDVPDAKFGDEVTEYRNIQEQLKIWYPDRSYHFMDNRDKLNHEAFCRLAWRRKIINEKTGGNIMKFKQEFPTVVRDAFLSSSKAVFSPERCVEMEEYINKNNIRPYFYRYHHDDEETSYKRKFYEAKYGHLEIFEYPEPTAVYVIGGDGAQGIVDGDSSALSVLKMPHMEEVATFADIISPDQFAGVANYLGLYYNTALLGMEINDKGGYAAVEKLVNFYRYPNMYYSQDLLARKRVGNIRYGFYTNPINRQVMITDLGSLIDNGDILIRSKRIISQLKTFVELPNGKLGAMSGKHDDLVISIMIAIQVARQAHIKRMNVPMKTPKWSADWWLDTLNKKRQYEGRFRRT